MGTSNIVSKGSMVSFSSSVCGDLAGFSLASNLHGLAGTCFKKCPPKSGQLSTLFQ